MFDEYGPRVSLKLGSERLYFLNDPDGVQGVFQRPGKTYEMGEEVNIPKLLTEKQLVVYALLLDAVKSQIRSFARGPRKKMARQVPEQEGQWLREGTNEPSSSR